MISPSRVTAGVTAAVLLATVGCAAAAVHVYKHEPFPSPPVLRVVPARSVIGVVTNDISGFRAATGAHVSVAVRYVSWGRFLPVQRITSMEGTGILPLIEIEPRGVTLRQVSDGSQDGYLKQIASQAQGARGKIALSFAPEMNGSWYSWGSHPRAFVLAWRHVVDLFRAQGVRNVSWVWVSHRALHPGSLRAYWPGDRYVTWAGLDGYYEHPKNSFQSLFTPSVKAIRSFTTRPVLITETAVGPGAGNVAAKIRDLFRSVARLRLLGLIWFDIAQHDPPDHQDWTVETRPAALAAFRAAVAAAKG